MKSDSTVLKKIAYVSIAAMAVLLAGGMFCYKERGLFADSAYIFFNTTNFRSMSIQEHRYGSFITQMVPYFGEQLHLPLSWVFFGYTISFNVFYLLVVCILVLALRKYALGILMSLYYFLFVSDSYYWTNNEIHQAVAWMFLMFGMTAYLAEKKAPAWISIPLSSLLCFITVFTHFVVIIPTAFLWVFFLMSKQEWQYTTRQNIVMAVVAAVCVAAKFYLTIDNSYDGSHLHGATHFSLKDVIDAFSTPVTTRFLLRCITNYWSAVVLCIAGLTATIMAKRWRVLAWTVLSMLGYVILMGLTYGGYDGGFPLFHIESEWASLSIIVAAPFVYYFLPAQKSRIAITAVIAVFLIRMAYIGNSYPVFKWRTDFKANVLAQMRRKKITKLAILNDNPLMARNILSWTIPEESLLLSYLDGDSPQLSFTFVNPDEHSLIGRLSESPGIGFAFGIDQPKDINRRYYTIDTTRPYQVMTYEQLMQ